MKYDPPAGTTPLVAMADMDMAVSIVWKMRNNEYYYFLKIFQTYSAAANKNNKEALNSAASSD